MKKIVNPVKYDVYGNRRYVNAYCKIEYENGRLSISGVIGPRTNGDCAGSCGQCSDEIRHGKPAQGWTREMVEKFCNIWDEWHLNDMRPYCRHQKELGWDTIAVKPVTLYHYSLNREASAKKRDAKAAALAALKKGESLCPAPDQVLFANLPYEVTLPEEISGEMAQYYEPKKPLFAGDSCSKEVKTLGWLTPDEHPDGILSRPCPVCGYKYGHDWKKEDVPDDVIGWLFALPDTTVEPAWV